MVRWPQCDHHSVWFDGSLSQGPAFVFGVTAPLMLSSKQDRWTIAEVGVHYQYDSWHFWILIYFTPDDYSHLHQRLPMSMTAFISFPFHVKPAMGSHSKHHFGLWLKLTFAHQLVPQRSLTFHFLVHHVAHYGLHLRCQGGKTQHYRETECINAKRMKMVKDVWYTLHIYIYIFAHVHVDHDFFWITVHALSDTHIILWSFHIQHMLYAWMVYQHCINVYDWAACHMIGGRCILLMWHVFSFICSS